MNDDFKDLLSYSTAVRLGMPSFEGIYDGKTVRLAASVKAKPNTRVTVTFPDEAEVKIEEAVTLDMVAGCLKRNGTPKTLEDMEAAIARGVLETIS